MSAVVLDASAAVSFLIPSQSTAASEAFVTNSDLATLIAPAIFTWEVTNILQRFSARGLRVGAFERALSELAGLEVIIAPPIPDDDVLTLSRYAVATGLRVFDAAYLSMAIDQDAQLASRDGRLVAVAQIDLPALS